MKLSPHNSEGRSGYNKQQHISQHICQEYLHPGTGNNPTSKTK